MKVPAKPYPRLNLPECRLRVARGEDGLSVWDELRGSWLVLTPEEWVRRHVCRWLVEHLRVLPAAIVQEYPVCVSGMPQRADIVVIGKDTRPVLLVECKAAAVGIDAGVYAQAVRYNAVVGASYLMITNGLVHQIYMRTPDGEHVLCEAFPDLSGCFR